MIIDIVQIDKTLPLPKRASAGASGFDLRASIKGRAGVGDVSHILAEVGYMDIHPGQIRVVPLGIKVAINLGYEIQIRARSGLAIKHGVTLVNGIGTIDSDFRGEFMAGLINLSGDIFRIHHGDRICQMIGGSVAPLWLHVTDTLGKTERDSGGLGHTGVK
jgi:dUTP pyrophosphatase